MKYHKTKSQHSTSIETAAATAEEEKQKNNESVRFNG